jgi:4-amino-4-deoxy-L-arabinose transferase-like glycosyltransferase
MLTTLKRYRFLIILSAIFILLRLPSLFEPYWYGDEGIYLVLGQAIRKGWLLYQQIHDNKPPTLYYFAALGQTVFGFRLLLSIFIAGSIYYFYKISLHFFTQKLSQLATIIFTILVSIPVIEGNIANAEVFMLLPTISGLYYFLYSTSRHKYLLSGLLLGVAFTIKVPVAVEFAFVCLVATIPFFQSSKIKLASRFKKIFMPIIQTTIGFLLPTIIYSVYFYIKGAFSEFIFAALLQNFGYLSSWSTGTHSGSATSGGITIRALILIIFWMVMYLLHIKQLISQKIFIISAWFGATIFGALLSTRPYPHYLIQLAPPLILAIFTLFEYSTRIFTRLIMLIMIGLSLILFCTTNFTFTHLFRISQLLFTSQQLTSSEYRSFLAIRLTVFIKSLIMSKQH